MAAMLVSVPLLLLVLCCCSGQRPAAILPVSAPAGRRVLVFRGGRVDLRPALELNLDTLPADTQCRVIQTPSNGSSCGSIIPDLFDCKNHTGPILYQHFGCFHHRELATFMVSLSPSSPTGRTPTRAWILSVEVLVTPPQPALAAFRLRTSSLGSTGTLNLKLVSPQNMVGRCHYEVVSEWPLLSLPMAGTLTGIVNQALPAGYIRNSSLTYQPRSTVSHNYTDYLLIKLYLHNYDLAFSNKTLHHAYAILPFEVVSEQRTSDEAANRVEEQLSRDFMTIHQTVNTPVSRSDFNFNLTSLQFVYFHFPVLETGAFRSLLSTSTNISHSVFTSHELLAGHVAFYPTDVVSSIHPFLYPYNITNRVGVLVGRGEMSVLVRERVWSGVVQRRNRPLSVLENSMAAINNLTLDFYTVGRCDAESTVRVLRPPEHGQLVLDTGGRMETVLLKAMRGSTLVRYRHLGGEDLTDVVYLGIKCPSSPELTVFLSVLVAPVDDTPPTLTIQSHLQAFRDWAVPLSPSSLLVWDPDSPRHQVQFTVDRLQGTLLHATQSITRYDSKGVLFPLVSLETLTSSLARVQLYEVLHFDLQDLEEQRIWYFPSGGLSYDAIELTVRDSRQVSHVINTLYVSVVESTPSEDLLISTPTQYPYVLKNKPLPLHQEGHMLLTSHFLYSKAPPSSPEKVMYLVTSAPQHGELCSLSSKRCPLTTFTQQDINYHKVVYRPLTSELRPDHFSFLVTVEGVQHVDAITHTFNWTVAQEDSVTSTREFWLNLGSIKPIRAKFLRTFSSLLQTTNLTFQITKQPRHGQLLLGDGNHFHASRPTSFTFTDAKEELVWYNHTQLRLTHQCDDLITFTVSSPSRQLRGQLPILFRTGRADLSVIVPRQQHVLKGLTHFTFSSLDFAITSSFCPDFVTFTVDTPPAQGQLTLRDRRHKTERQLMEGSTFTAKDIQLEFVSYRLTLSDKMPTSNISDGFVVNASDPVSVWPDRDKLETQPKAVDYDPGHFVVIIVPSPAEEYRLEVNFSSGHPLTWLPNQQSYGYALTSADIDLLNTTLQPREVVIQVESGLTLGNLALRDTPISFFNIEDLQAGGVVYVKSSLIPDQVFRDVVGLGVYAYLPGFFQKAALHQFVLEWALVGLEKAEIVVSEHQRTVQLTIR